MIFCISFACIICCLSSKQVISRQALNTCFAFLWLQACKLQDCSRAISPRRHADTVPPAWLYQSIRQSEQLLRSAQVQVLQQSFEQPRMRCASNIPAAINSETQEWDACAQSFAGSIVMYHRPSAKPAAQISDRFGGLYLRSCQDLGSGSSEGIITGDMCNRTL